MCTCVCVFACVHVLTGIKLMCRRLEWLVVDTPSHTHTPPTHTLTEHVTNTHTHWACPLDEQLSFITGCWQPLSHCIAPTSCLPYSSLSAPPFTAVLQWSPWSCHSVSPTSAYRFTDLYLTTGKCLHANFSHTSFLSRFCSSNSFYSPK